MGLGTATVALRTDGSTYYYFYVRIPTEKRCNREGTHVPINPAEAVETALRHLVFEMVDRVNRQREYYGNTVRSDDSVKISYSPKGGV